MGQLVEIRLSGRRFEDIVKDLKHKRIPLQHCEMFNNPTFIKSHGFKGSKLAQPKSGLLSKILQVKIAFLFSLQTKQIVGLGFFGEKLSFDLVN